MFIKPNLKSIALSIYFLASLAFILAACFSFAASTNSFSLPFLAVIFNSSKINGI